jgi:hypothetical protein
MKNLKLFLHPLAIILIFSFLILGISIADAEEGDSEVVLFEQYLSYSGNLEIMWAPDEVLFEEIYRGEAVTFGLLAPEGDEIRIRNHQDGINEWTLSLAAGEPEWTDGHGSSFKYDGETSEGRLDVSDLSEIPNLVDGLGVCSENNILGVGGTNFASFPVIDLIIAGETAEGLCLWDISGIGLSQHIPVEQEIGDYSIDMVLTVA